MPRAAGPTPPASARSSMQLCRQWWVQGREDAHRRVRWIARGLGRTRDRGARGARAGDRADGAMRTAASPCRRREQFCYLVRDCQLAWFEEPVTADDKRGLAEVRSSHPYPDRQRRSDCTRFDFRDLIDLPRRRRRCSPISAICGGISEAMRIGAMASRREPARGAASVGRRAGLRRRPAFRSGLPCRAHPRVFARRQPHDPRPGRGALHDRRTACWRFPNGRAWESRVREDFVRSPPQAPKRIAMEGLDQTAKLLRADPQARLQAR